jgi:tetratricopeptide (TPR) repeat protein
MDLFLRAGALYWLLVLGAVLGLFVIGRSRRYLQQAFGLHGSVPATCGLTGASAARRLLAAAGLPQVHVVRSNTVDCYHPRKKEVQLRDATFDSLSLGALAIAAHEVGHAQQFAAGFFPARLRLRIRPITYLFLAAAVLFAVLAPADLSLPWTGAGLASVGFLLMLVQAPVVLPLEFDASRRANALVRDQQMLAPFEESGFKQLLAACGRTYVAWEGLRWIMLIAASIALLWLSPIRPFEPGSYLAREETFAPLHDSDSLSGPVVPAQYANVNTDLMGPLFSTVAMLVPALLLVLLLSRLTTSVRGRKTSHVRAVERNNAAQALSQRGELTEAIEGFTSALALDRKLFAAYFNRAHCYLRLGRIDEALADIESSLQLNPNFVDAIAVRGHIATLRGKYDLARADLEKAMEMAPNNPAAFTYRGNLWVALGDHERARADYDRAIEVHPAENRAYQGRGLVWLVQGRLDAALADCSQALASGANDSSAYSLRGQVWLAKNDHDRAIADFTAAIAKAPQLADPLRDRGLAYYLKGDLDHALADLNEAIRLSPQDAVAFNNRGAAYLKAGRYAESVADLETAIRLKPDFPNPHKHLAWLRATCADPAFRDGGAAVSHATRGLELCKEVRAEWCAVAAGAYAEAGDFDHAVRWQTKCMEQSSAADEPAMQERLSLFESRQPFRDYPLALPNEKK